MVKQAQLADRGAPAMVLLVLTAKDGEQMFSKILIFIFSLPLSLCGHFSSFQVRSALSSIRP